MFFPTAEGLIGHVGRVSYILVTLIHPVKVEYFSLHAVARFFLKKWANPSLFFVYFCSFLVTISIQIEKKHRWCPWDSNLGPQDGRRRQNHGAMQPPTVARCYL